MFASFFDFALAVYCIYTHVYQHVQCIMYFSLTGPGRVEIVNVTVTIEEERSQMKVTLRKVRLLQ